VHWKGYEDDHDQWIAESGLPHAKETIENYWTRLLWDALDINNFYFILFYFILDNREAHDMELT